MTTASPLNPIDFPLSGTRLIEASAGTGKTYTIAALYVRLILGHDLDNQAQRRDLLPPDILVVTFTEAATKELRERIRERLSQTARFFCGQAVNSDAFLEAIRAGYEKSAWPACARRLELAANWMDESAVYTIHSWCNRMLQQHAFDSGSLLRQEVNTDDTELLNEVVRDYWRTFFYDIAN
ncbi:MAG: UvrD-helicase domain-containing protein, partial [Methylovulum sp.]|nr:UvrD-helicase domain-containing protein [Methylovulum sp.]